MSLEMMLIAAVAVLVAVVAFLVFRSRRRPAEPGEPKRRDKEELDVVGAWPPEVTRLLTGGERSAHEVLVKALPECMVFAQVPLARFIKVPRRHSYAEWLTRAGHLCADLLITDRATLVIGAVLLQSSRESERAQRRRAQLTRVLKAAKVKVFVWREESLPSVDWARDQVIQKVGTTEERAEAAAAAAAAAPAPGRPGRGDIPVPEVLSEEIDDGPRREPPPSTWFDDLDSGRMPLDSGRVPFDTSSRAPLDSSRMPLDSGHVPLDDASRRAPAPARVAATGTQRPPGPGR